MSREKALASEEEKKVQVINADVAKKQKACQEDLAKAEPALIAAKSALGTLNKVHNMFLIHTSIKALVYVSSISIVVV